MTPKSGCFQSNPFPKIRGATNMLFLKSHTLFFHHPPFSEILFEFVWGEDWILRFRLSYSFNSRVHHGREPLRKNEEPPSIEMLVFSCDTTLWDPCLVTVEAERVAESLSFLATLKTSCDPEAHVNPFSFSTVLPEGRSWKGPTWAS